MVRILNYGNKKVADAFKLLFVSFGGYEENVYFIFQARGNPVKIYTFQIKKFLTLTWRRVLFWQTVLKTFYTSMMIFDSSFKYPPSTMKVYLYGLRFQKVLR